jgi:hypothetical protein
LLGLLNDRNVAAELTFPFDIFLALVIAIMVLASLAEVLFSCHQMRRCFPSLDVISFSCVERISASQASIEYKIFFAIFLEVPFSEEFRVFILL